MNVVEEPKVCPINITSRFPLLHKPEKHLMSYLRHIKCARKSNVLKRSGIWFHVGNSRIAASMLPPETLLSSGLQVPLYDLQAHVIQVPAGNYQGPWPPALLRGQPPVVVPVPGGATGPAAPGYRPQPVQHLLTIQGFLPHSATLPHFLPHSAHETTCW